MAYREQLWIPWEKGKMPKDFNVKHFEVHVNAPMWRPIERGKNGMIRPSGPPPKQLELFT